MLIGELDLLPVMFGTSWRYLFTQDLTGIIPVCVLHKRAYE